MRFQPPGGELTVWSVLWILFAVLSVAAAVVTENPAHYFFAACIGLPSLGLWLGQRWCGYVLAGCFALSIPLAILALIAVDETLLERGIRLFRIVLAGYFAFITFRWAHSEV